jgi:hypothetical protein
MRVASHNRVLISLMKLRQRVRSQPDMISATELWRRAKIVLICFPDEYEDRQAAEPALRAIVEACPGKRFCVLTTKALPQRWLNVELVRLKRDDLNLFSMPNSEFMRYIQYKRIDVAIDLWPPFNLTTACLCQGSGASLRVGFSSEHAAVFYNLLVVPSGSQGSAVRRYDVIVDTILNLEGSGVEIEN